MPQELLSHVSVLIVDEAHHIIAPTYLKIYNNILDAGNPKLVLGLTATLTH